MLFLTPFSIDKTCQKITEEFGLSESFETNCQDYFLVTIALGIVIPLGIYLYHSEGQQAQRIRKLYQGDYSLAFPGKVTNFGLYEMQSLQHMTETERVNASKRLYLKTAESAQLSQEDSVLEVGCGKGAGLLFLIEEFDLENPIGIDKNSEQIEQAQKSAQEMGVDVEFVYKDACNLPYRNQFTKIICVEASQHFLNLDGFMKSAYRSLKSGGKIAIAVFLSPTEEGVSYLKKHIKTVEEEIDLIPSLNNFCALMENAGFQHISTESIGGQVFRFFEAWLNQVRNGVVVGRNWTEAYEKKMVDYYIITAEKVG